MVLPFPLALWVFMAEGDLTPVLQGPLLHTDCYIHTVLAFYTDNFPRLKIKLIMETWPLDFCCCYWVYHKFWVWYIIEEGNIKIVVSDSMMLVVVWWVECNTNIMKSCVQIYTVYILEFFSLFPSSSLEYHLGLKIQFTLYFWPYN